MFFIVTMYAPSRVSNRLNRHAFFFQKFPKSCFRLADKVWANALARPQLHEYLARLIAFGVLPQTRHPTSSLSPSQSRSCSWKHNVFTTNCTCLICQTMVPEITKATKYVITAENSNYNNMYPQNACIFFKKKKKDP